MESFTEIPSYEKPLLLIFSFLVSSIFQPVTSYGGFGTGTSTSEIDILGAMVIGLGYRF